MCKAYVMADLKIPDLCMYAASMARRRRQQGITDREFELLARLFAVTGGEDGARAKSIDIIGDTDASRHHLTSGASKGFIHVTKSTDGPRKENMYTVSPVGFAALHYVLGVRVKK